jgi:hypothetical protein
MVKKRRGGVNKMQQRKGAREKEREFRHELLLAKMH